MLLHSYELDVFPKHKGRWNLKEDILKLRQ
jgi:hypothetical protein